MRMVRGICFPQFRLKRRGIQPNEFAVFVGTFSEYPCTGNDSIRIHDIGLNRKAFCAAGKTGGCWYCYDAVHNLL